MSNVKPLIAMASSYQGGNTIALRQTYFNAIYDAGGIPVPISGTCLWRKRCWPCGFV